MRNTSNILGTRMINTIRCPFGKVPIGGTVKNRACSVCVHLIALKLASNARNRATSTPVAKPPDHRIPGIVRYATANGPGGCGVFVARHGSQGHGVGTVLAVEPEGVFGAGGNDTRMRAICGGAQCSSRLVLSQALAPKCAPHVKWGFCSPAADLDRGNSFGILPRRSRSAALPDPVPVQKT